MFTLKQNLKSLQEKISREYIFQQYPWLKEKDKYMITHNDLDGILTALLLQDLLGWKLIGVYDLERIWVSKSFNGSMKDVIFVDLDVTRKGFRSLGHHIIGHEDDSCNMNNLFSINQLTYREKFPLSTALFLYWLYEKDLPNKLINQLFILHSDSVWDNYTKYTENVTNWLELLQMNDLLEILQDKSTIPTIRKYVLPRMIGWNKQCGYTVSNGCCVFKQSNEDFQQFVNNMAKTLEVDTIMYPTDIEEKYHFKRQVLKVNPYKFDKELEQIKERYNIFSYSLKYKDTIDISHF